MDLHPSRQLLTTEMELVLVMERKMESFAGMTSTRLGKTNTEMVVLQF